MKKVILSTGLVVLLLAGAMLLFGRNREVTIEPWTSELYSDTYIRVAINAAKGKVGGLGDDRTLLALRYAGDEKSVRESEYYGQKDAIALYCDFCVSPGHKGSFNPGSTYRNWMLLMAKNALGVWTVVEQGYA